MRVWLKLGGLVVGAVVVVESAAVDARVVGPVEEGTVILVGAKEPGSCGLLKLVVPVNDKYLAVSYNNAR